MRFRQKMIRTYAAIKFNGTQSLTILSQLTGYSISSICRQIKKIKSRSHVVGASFFETSEGDKWLRTLVIAAILVFGLQATVGADHLSLFFELICVGSFVAVSSRSISRLKTVMMSKLADYQEELQPTLDALSGNIHIIAGADETFFERLLILLYMDLGSGFILTAQNESNRRANTWHNNVSWISDKFKSILCLVSDRGQALIKLAKTSKIQSVAELYHLQQSVVRLFKFAFSSKRRSFQKQERELQKTVKELMDSKADEALLKEYQQSLDTIKEKNITIDKGQKAYKEELKKISIAVHPFNEDSAPKESVTLTAELNSSLSTLKKIAQACGIDDTHNRLDYFNNNITPMSSLVDLWWLWVKGDVELQTQDPQLQEWLVNTLLPVYYWRQQIKKSRASKDLKEYYSELYEKAKKALSDNPLINAYYTPQWCAWATEWVLKFQRSTSQVEGRNARLSEHHHRFRGMNESQIQTQTILHNFWITRQDGTTAAERLFKIKPPNLFEWLLKNMPELADPRQRKLKSANSVALSLTALAA